ncbi:MAG: acylphosphatase [Alphaproteobacteria bacterium]|nr:acylphosphatase [Alphaproteobacteria bacterium]
MTGERRIVRVLVRGRVQGVGYRAWTDAKASELGLDGWVRNLRDGRVEAVFAGAPDVVARMIDACRSGPRLARVDALDVVEAPGAEAGPGFGTRPTD